MQQTTNLKLNKIELMDEADITVINPNWDSIDTEITDMKKKMADTSYVDTKVAELVGSAPGTLDTLNELAKALGNDPDFATTVATQIGTKVDKVEGKGLSTNDYTTAEKTKLAGIATNANNYVHPLTHPASMITDLHSVATTGKADTATKLATPRTINGVSFDGSSDIVITANANGGISTATNYVNVNNTEAKNSGRLQFFQKYNDAIINPDTGWWSTVRTQHSGYDNGYWQEMAYSFSGDVVKFRRNVNGTLSSWRTFAFTDSSITGNAGTATKLQTARTINGVSFDGTQNITVVDDTKLPLSGGTLTGALNINSQIKSTVATGTAPLTISSTTVVTNLNADMVDGLHSSHIARKDISNLFVTEQQFGNGGTWSDPAVGIVCAIKANGKVIASDEIKSNTKISSGNCSMQYNAITESLDFIFV